VLDRSFDGPATFLSAAHIGLNEYSVTARRDNVGNDLFSALNAATGNGDRRAFSREPSGGSAANSRGAAGYQGHLAFESHTLSLPQ
jgi:hypothetical protein